MKKILEIILSSIIFIIGIFLLIYLLSKSYIYEAIEIGCCLSLIAFVISPIINLFYDEDLRIIDKLILILLVFNIYYLLKYVYNLNSSYLLFDISISKLQLIIYIIIGIILLFLLIYVLKAVSYKHRPIFKILVLLLVVSPYFITKGIYVYRYNMLSKRSNINFKTKSAIKPQEVEDKYYFNNVYSENMFNNYIKMDYSAFEENSFALKNEDENKGIVFNYNNDYVNNYYNSINKKDFISNHIVDINRYLIKNNLKNLPSILENHSKESRVNILDWSSKIYYQYLIIENMNESMDYEYIQTLDKDSYEIILMRGLRANDSIDIFDVFLTERSSTYEWTFLGDHSLDEIYDFISTLNVEKNK